MSDILIKRDSRIDAKIDPAAGSINLSPTGSDGWRSNLRHAAIGEDLGTIDETAVIGSEEHRHLADLVRIADAAGRNVWRQKAKQSLLLICRHQTDQAGCFDRAGAQRIDADLAFLEIERPATGEIAHRRLGGAIDAEGRRSHDAGGRAGQDDGSAIAQ